MNTGKPRRPRKFNRGALILVMGFFLASGLLRLGSGTGSAIAREVEALRHNDDPPKVMAGPACEIDEGLGELLADLKARKEKLDAREAKLADRMQALAVAEVGVKGNLAALIKAEQNLRDTIALADSAAEDDLSKLTSVYENMKAKDATELFEEMDPQFSAGFLARMRSDAAAAILSGLTPSKAYSISVILAGRNADVPTGK